MDLGNCFYKEKRGHYGYLILAVFMALPPLSLFDDMSLWVKEPFFCVGCVLMSIGSVWMGLPKKNYYQFHEQGIGYYEKGRLIRFDAYHELPAVECLQETIHAGRGSTASDILIFWRSDASYIKLKFKASSPDVRKLWQNITTTEPLLVKRFNCYQMDNKSEALYHELKDLAQKGGVSQ